MSLLDRTAPTQLAVRAVREAEEILHRKGTSYVYGKEGPKQYDCSGLVWDAYLKAGHRFKGRSASDLLHETLRVPRFQRLLPGDLIFYYSKVKPSHIAIYVGRTGKVGRRKYWVIQATNPARGIEKIEMNRFTRAKAYGRVRI